MAFLNLHSSFFMIFSFFCVKSGRRLFFSCLHPLASRMSYARKQDSLLLQSVYTIKFLMRLCEYKRRRDTKISTAPLLLMLDNKTKKMPGKRFISSAPLPFASLSHIFTFLSTYALYFFQYIILVPICQTNFHPLPFRDVELN